jgi:3-phenylpropionate/trans-cinnamate dioxygenase ferredoxin reductase subunit
VTRPERIVIVGASLAGQRAARALRNAGFGGELTLVGDENHAPYNRPPLSKAVLRGQMSLADLALDRAADPIDARWLLGKRATRLALHANVLGVEGGDEIPFDAALIATGVRARKLNIPGAGLQGVHYLRTYDDAVQLRSALDAAKSVVVVGAGFIGCEVAASAVQMGLSVSVVDPAAAPMERVLGRELAGAARKLHEQNGIRFFMARTVVGLEGHQTVTHAVLDSGERLQADVVVVGIGSVPNTEWLEDSGIPLANGVACDEACLVPGTGGRVAAAGDVASWPHQGYGGRRMRVEHWSQAAEQGEAAALALLDPVSAPAFMPTLSMWSDQYGKKIQAVGAPWLADSIEIDEGSVEAHKFCASAYLDGRLVGAVLFSTPARVAAYRTRLERESAVQEPQVLTS